VVNVTKECDNIELHEQTFQVKSTKMLEVYRMMHSRADNMREVIIVEGIDICPKAWKIIHNVSL